MCLPQVFFFCIDLQGGCLIIGFLGLLASVQPFLSGQIFYGVVAIILSLMLLIGTYKVSIRCFLFIIQGFGYTHSCEMNNKIYRANRVIRSNDAGI